MRPEFTLEQVPACRLIMTPKLAQAIELLSMTSAELDAFLMEQVAENPVLELVESRWEQPAGVMLERVKIRDRQLSGGVTANPPFEIPSPVDGYGELESDIRLSDAPVVVRQAARQLVNSLDRRGFLPTLDDSLAGQLGVPLAELVRGKQLLQQLGPPGFAAESLEESLLHQLACRNALTPLAEKVIRHHLSEIPQPADKLAAKLAVPLRALEQAILDIRACDPHPGARFDCYGIEASVVPDVYIVSEQGGYRAVVNQSIGNRVVVSELYRELTASCDDHTRAYLEERMRHALWVMWAVEHRKETMQRIADAVVAFQQQFLTHGVSCLRPLTMSLIAQAVAVHESTVSRVVSGKFALTPRGLFPLRAFFGSGVAGLAGPVSSQAVKALMQRLVKEEDATRPLSDEDIKVILAGEGICLSRRTVAKYRESIGIPSSPLRRKRGDAGHAIKPQHETT